MNVLGGTIRALLNKRKEKGALWIVKKGILLLWQGATMERVEKKEWERRLKACYRCPMFTRTWSEIAKNFDGEPICYGCGCFMPAKAMFRPMECWANENGIEELEGWRREKE